MKQELARTLTVALSNFIDENRKGRMCMSSLECEDLEKAFKADNYQFVEKFLERKLLPDMTEFEEGLVKFYNERTSLITDPLDKNDLEEILHRNAANLLAIARKDLPRWKIWENGACGNSEGIPIALVKTTSGYRLQSCLGIPGEKYIMLTDLEELPGFNEEKQNRI